MTTRSGLARATIVGVSLAALLAACSGSAATPPAAAASAPTQPTGGAVSGSAAPAASSPASAGAGSPGDACKIVPIDAINAAVGFPATADGTTTICYFQNTDKSKYLVISLFASQADMALMLQIEPGSKHIDGLGSDAFWAASGGILFVRQGDRGFEFFDPDFIPTTLDAPVPDALITLAKLVLPNL